MSEAQNGAGRWRDRTVGYGTVKADQLLANPNNWRVHPKHQQDALLTVLDKVGWVDDVIVNQRTGCVVDGHLRVSLAISNDEDVPVKYVDLSEDEEGIILATFDTISAMAATDPEMLSSLMAHLRESDLVQENPAIHTLLQGVAKQTGAEYATTDPPDAPDAEVDRAEELRDQWGTAPGQLWELPSVSVPGRCHRLLCGDSTNPDDVARLMQGERADGAWFDPPFGIDLQPQRRKTDVIAGDTNADARQIWTAFLPLLHQYLKDDTALFLCQGWSEFDWTLPLVRQYFETKSKVTWVKQVWGIGWYLRPQHEDILYCWKGTPPKPDDPISDVWEIDRISAPIHAAEKPPELMARAFAFATQPNDLVIDWFCGVGGSLVAAEQYQRIAYCIELAPEYVAVILQRMAALGLTPRLVE